MSSKTIFPVRIATQITIICRSYFFLLLFVYWSTISNFFIDIINFLIWTRTARQSSFSPKQPWRRTSLLWRITRKHQRCWKKSAINAVNASWNSHSEAISHVACGRCIRSEMASAMQWMRQEIQAECPSQTTDLARYSRETELRAHIFPEYIDATA